MHHDRRHRISSIISVSCGNCLEMYDFMVFGYFADHIGRVFFPTHSPFLSLLLSLATFGTGFLARPVGAVLLGPYFDGHGRRKGLLLTLGMMATGVVVIACLPGYGTIGLLAPFLVVVSRLIQGLSAGVELGGVSVYLAEIASPGRRGFYVSWQSASQQISVILAALVGAVLEAKLPPAAMDAWGWRLPFLLGSLLVPLLFRLRQSLAETETFLSAKRHPEFKEVVHSLVTHWRLVLRGTMLVTMTTVSFYFITAYTPTFGGDFLHLRESKVLLVTCLVGLSNFLWLPIFGSLSDRVGRRPLLILFSGLTLLTAYPLLAWLAAAPSFPRLVTVELWLSLLFSGYNGAMVVALTEMMPPGLRTSGFSLAYSLATALFGGFTPALLTYLIHTTGNRAIGGLWLSAAALCGLTATLRFYEVDSSG